MFPTKVGHDEYTCFIKVHHQATSFVCTASHMALQCSAQSHSRPRNTRYKQRAETALKADVSNESGARRIHIRCRRQRGQKRFPSTTQITSRLQTLAFSILQINLLFKMRDCALSRFDILSFLSLPHPPFFIPILTT